MLSNLNANFVTSLQITNICDQWQVKVNSLPYVDNIQAYKYDNADRVTRLILFRASLEMYEVLSISSAPSTNTSAWQTSRPTRLLAQHEYRPTSLCVAWLTRSTHSPFRDNCMLYLLDGRISRLPWYHWTCNIQIINIMHSIIQQFICNHI